MKNRVSLWVARLKQGWRWVGGVVVWVLWVLVWVVMVVVVVFFMVVGVACSGC